MHFGTWPSKTLVFAVFPLSCLTCAHLKQHFRILWSMSHRIASHYTAQYRDHNFPVTIPFTGMDRPFTIGIVGKVLVCLLMISWYLVCLVYLIFQFLSFLSWLALWCYRVLYHIASSQHIVWYCIVEPLQLDCNHSTGGVKEWWITHNLEHVCVYIYIYLGLGFKICVCVCGHIYWNESYVDCARTRRDGDRNFHETTRHGDAWLFPSWLKQGEAETWTWKRNSDLDAKTHKSKPQVLLKLRFELNLRVDSSIMLALKKNREGGKTRKMRKEDRMNEPCFVAHLGSRPAHQTGMNMRW